MTRSLLTVVLMAVPAAVAMAQTSGAPHSGGFSPFRGRGFAGGDGPLAVSILQEGCPVETEIASVRRDDRGVVLTLRVENVGDRPVDWQTLAILAFAADGTPRGAQRQKLSARRAPGESGSIEIALRTMSIAPTDRIAVAVQEVGGETAWRIESRALDRYVRSTLWP